MASSITLCPTLMSVTLKKAQILFKWTTRWKCAGKVSVYRLFIYDIIVSKADKMDICQKVKTLKEIV